MSRASNKQILNCVSLLVFVFIVSCSSSQPPIKSVPEDIMLPGVSGLDIKSSPTETDGFIQVEAESFQGNHANGTPRDWVLGKTDSINELAGGNNYMAVMPDTRVTHDDELIIGTNFFPESGTGSILSYKVYFNTPGHYYVWARCYSSGSEDNGVHAGVDGYWPESSARVQWCEDKNQWTWSSAQRVEDNPCGTPNTITLDILEPGYHTIMFSVREDGFKFDQWLMTLDEKFTP